jgi:hypothetical protein
MYPTRALERLLGGIWVLVETAGTPEGHRRLERLHGTYSDLYPATPYRVVERSHLKGGEDRVVLS